MRDFNAIDMSGKGAGTGKAHTVTKNVTKPGEQMWFKLSAKANMTYSFTVSTKAHSKALTLRDGPSRAESASHSLRRALFNATGQSRVTLSLR